MESEAFVRDNNGKGYAHRREVRAIFDLMPKMKLRSGLDVVEVGARFCASFGGYTAQTSWGCWRNGTELDLVFDMSVSFTVAIHHADWPAFKDLARVLAHGQETLYVVSPWGVPEVIEVGPQIDGDAGTQAFIEPDPPEWNPQSYVLNSDPEETQPRISR